MCAILIEFDPLIDAGALFMSKANVGRYFQPHAKSIGNDQIGFAVRPRDWWLIISPLGPARKKDRRKTSRPPSIAVTLSRYIAGAARVLETEFEKDADYINANRI